MNLYDVALVGQQIQDFLEKSEGELSPEAEAIFDKLLSEGPERLEAAAMVVKQLDAYQAECKAEEARLAERRKAFEANANKLKERMRWALDAAFSGKVKTAKFTLWTQKAPDTVAVELKEGMTPELLFHEFPELVRVKYELDKIAVMDARHSGEYLPSYIFVEEKPGSRYIRIK